MTLTIRDLDLGEHDPVLSVERRAKSASGYRDMEMPAPLAELIRDRISGWPLTAWVWPSPKSVSGHREKTWILKAVKALCAEAAVQVVCPQGLRVTHAKMAREAGTTAHVIAQQLGHANTKVTTENYIGPETDQAERQRAALKVLRGGREG